MKLKLKLICGLAVATALSWSGGIPAVGQVGIYIGSAPPPLRYERRGPEPGPGYAWVDGYWAPNGRHYRWVAGRWDRPAYEGAYWNHPHYDHQQQGWQLHEGHWDHEDHSKEYRTRNDDHGHDR